MISEVLKSISTEAMLSCLLSSPTMGKTGDLAFLAFSLRVALKRKIQIVLENEVS